MMHITKTHAHADENNKLLPNHDLFYSEIPKIPHDIEDTNRVDDSAAG